MSNRVSIALSTVLIGAFLGYVSGLATQPMLALVSAAALAIGSVLLSLFKVAKLSDQQGLANLDKLLEMAPHANPIRFFIATLLFTVSTCVGVNVGMYQRTYVPQVDVTDEATRYGHNLEMTDRIKVVDMLKRLYESGYTQRERLFVIGDDANMALQSEVERLNKQLLELKSKPETPAPETTPPATPEGTPAASQPSVADALATTPVAPKNELDAALAIVENMKPSENSGVDLRLANPTPSPAPQPEPQLLDKAREGAERFIRNPASGFGN